MKKTLNRKLFISPSCFIRECHPETCCCKDNEYGVQEEKVDGRGHVYHDNLFFGSYDACEKYIESQNE